MPRARRVPRAASISVAMSATMKATPWKEPIGRPNCSRVWAYGIEASSAPCAMPTASAPIEMRPPSRIRRNSLKPLPCSPSRFAAGTRAPSNSSSPVADACRPSLSSSRPTEKPGVSAGTMNALISADPSSRVPVRAVTTYVPAWPALVMNRLAAVEDPPAAVGAVLEPRRRPCPARIAPGARFGQAVRADDRPAGHRDQEALLLVVRAGQMERPAAEARMGRHDEAERTPHPADLLDGDGVGEGVETGAALLLGDRDAEPAELADAADDLDREASLALVLVDDGCDLGEHEVTDRVAQEGVLGRQVEVHRSSVAPGLRLPGTGATVGR